MGVGDAAEDEWLEAVEGPTALAWRDAENSACLASLGDPTAGSPLYDSILRVLDSDEKLTPLTKIDNSFYNFWIDARNPRGLWRRLRSLEALPSGEWETVLDLDALGKAEGESWVWHGCVSMVEEKKGVPHDRVLLELSRGGSDAAVIREFSLLSKTFIPVEGGGFEVPEAKSSVAYKGANVLLVASSAVAETSSGYARKVQEWQRGTDLSDARTVFEAEYDDMMTTATWYKDRGVEWETRNRMVDFYHSEQWLCHGGVGQELIRLPVPLDVSVVTFGSQLHCTLRSEWLGFPAGSLLACDADALLGTQEPTAQSFTALFTPSDSTFLQASATTQHFVILTLLDSVKSKIIFLEYLGDGEYVELSESEQQLGSVADNLDLMTIAVSAVDPNRSDAFWMTVEGFTTPTIYYYCDSPQHKPRQLQSLPSLFDGSACTVSQHFATSLDGTSVPYFEVSSSGSAGSGDKTPTPTLLYGYGGFEISMTPAYSPSVGVGWLEKGGTYVVANIRGGGEFGPAWHQSALRENRCKAYDDFIAVAEDLIARGVCTPDMLGTQGGSNGGLLMGARA
jgi:prolyl oligopeptidase